LDTVLVI